MYLDSARGVQIMIWPVTGVLKMKLLIEMGGRNAQAVRKPRAPPSRGQVGKAGLAPQKERPLWVQVSSGCHNQVLQTRQLKQQGFISHGSGGWSHGQALVRALFRTCRRLPSHCVLTGRRERQTETERKCRERGWG